jgi:sec-independent protein translocase protein TatA
MSLGIWEIILLIVLVLLIFGAGKLPTVMQDVAKGVKAFRQGLNDDQKDQSKSQ